MRREEQVVEEGQGREESLSCSVQSIHISTLLQVTRARFVATFEEALRRHFLFRHFAHPIPTISRRRCKCA